MIDIPLRGTYWEQSAVVQKSSKGLPWYHCLLGLKMICFGQYISILATIQVDNSENSSNTGTDLPSYNPGRICSKVVRG